MFLIIIIILNIYLRVLLTTVLPKVTESRAENLRSRGEGSLSQMVKMIVSL